MMGEEKREGPDDKKNHDDNNEGGVDESSKNILSACLRGVGVTEVFSLEQNNQVCHGYRLAAGTSFVIRNGWNFDNNEDRRSAWKCIRAEDPLFIIGSPPCTMLSELQAFNPARQGKDEQSVDKSRE